MARRSTFRGGIFVTGLDRRPDRVVISLFASRPTPLDELRRRLRLYDSAGTAYVLLTREPEVIDGRGQLVFTPSAPEGVTWLKLEEPGSGLVWRL